jgi:surface carbohydrate biosynthesis protein
MIRKTTEVGSTLSGDGEAVNIFQSKMLQKRKKKFCFAKPLRSSVVIYDSTGSEFVAEAIGKERSFCTLEVRDTINLHFSIVLRAVGLVLFRIFSKDINWRLASSGVIYDRATLMTMKPKVVLTFIDNSHRFGVLSRIYPKAQFFAIQNGFRGPRVQDFPRIIHVTNLFCHGQETIDKYKEAGHNVDRYIIVGSLKDGLYRAQQKAKNQKRFNICFISEYRYERFSTSMPGAAYNAKILLSYIERFCRENDASVCVACSSKNTVVEGLNESALERQYITENISIEDLELIPNDGRFSTYSAIDRSDIAINLQSTIGLEALGRGCKVLFCNVTGDPYYDIPGVGETGIWALQVGENGYDVFKARITEILGHSDEEWRVKTEKVAGYFVSSEENVLPQQKIVEELAKHV